jgi:hypothetical protein
MDEMEMRRAEARIPELAAKAGRAAHERALKVRGSVMVVVGADLVEKDASGDFKFIRRIGDPVKVIPGQVLHRRK